ncbi:MAG: hypothetical protein R2942_19590 [Ignavibacteria bacterium]
MLRLFYFKYGNKVSAFRLAIGHLVLNPHPLGLFIGVGTSPLRIVLSLFLILDLVMERQITMLYCRGESDDNESGFGVRIHIFPRYITEILEAICSTTDRS